MDTPRAMAADDEKSSPREAATIGDSQHSSSGDRIDLGMYSARALRFEILPTSAPTSHKFYTSQLTAAFRFAYLDRMHIEHEMLSSLLPDGIYVRTWEDRIDLFRLLIIGRYDTVHELAPFVFDFHLGPSFPEVGPSAFFYFRTNGEGKFHPSLREVTQVLGGIDKIWLAPDKTQLFGSNANLLRFFVLFKSVLDCRLELSVQALNQNKKMEIWAMTRSFIGTALESPPDGLADVIRWLYLPGQDGPCHLERVIVKPRLILNDVANGAENDQAKPKPMWVQNLLGSPALKLLSEYVEWLEKYLEDYRKTPGVDVQGSKARRISLDGVGAGADSGGIELEGTWADYVEREGESLEGKETLSEFEREGTRIEEVSRGGTETSAEPIERRDLSLEEPSLNGSETEGAWELVEVMGGSPEFVGAEGAEAAVTAAEFTKSDGIVLEREYLENVEGMWADVIKSSIEAQRVLEQMIQKLRL